MKKEEDGIKVKVKQKKQDYSVNNSVATFKADHLKMRVKMKDNKISI